MKKNYCLLSLFFISVLFIFSSCNNILNEGNRSTYSVTVLSNRLNFSEEQFKGTGEYKPGEKVTISMNWDNTGEYFVGFYDQYLNLIGENSVSTFYMPKDDLQITAYFYKEGDKPLFLGDVVYFGMYPQTICSSIESKYYSPFITQDYSTYKQFDFYVNGTLASDTYYYYDYDLQIEEEYISKKFRFVKYDPQHFYNMPLRLSDCLLPFPSTIKLDDIDSRVSTWSIMEDLTAYNYENGFLTNGHYFYEPIRWKILSASNGKALIMSEKALDSQQFYHSLENRIIDDMTVYPNNWEHSDIRKWLNNDFYNTAFTKGCENYILETTLDNKNTAKQVSQENDDSHLIRIGANDSTKDQNDTTDKVFLPSAKDCCTELYGFYNDNDGWDSARKFKPTDYAKLMGIRIDYGNYSYGDVWGSHPEALMDGYVTHVWTRSGIEKGYSFIGINSEVTNNQGVVAMDNAGDLEQVIKVTKTCIGVVPVMTVIMN